MCWTILHYVVSIDCSVNSDGCTSRGKNMNILKVGVRNRTKHGSQRYSQLMFSVAV